ncbi:hypothetical protein MYAM1_001821 [Malassezia yamatoensis]|uniref:Swiss Army Knife protein DSP-PTPase phosphatase domain-containing protein n=1 Tax=Malassezia yamatoensis TaxID=253288 RepID=A0AAJ5YYY1_9BASI|nr:hypothetical protein MYAM1_001821 [Malassezia yamatoensis]
MESVAVLASASSDVGAKNPNCNEQQPDILSSQPSVAQRDRLAQDVYQSVLQTGRGDWIDLMNCAPLASQYHLSTYCTFKFGFAGTPLVLTLGAPYAYLPLSLQQPLVTETTLARQRQAEKSSWTWYLHDPSQLNLDDMDLSAEQSKTAFCSRETDCFPEQASSSAHDTPSLYHKSMRDAIQLARMQNDTSMQEPTPCTIKTSNSHPIQVSPILPPSMLDEISEQVFSVLPPEYTMQDSFEQSSASNGCLRRGKHIPQRMFREQLNSVLQDPEPHLAAQIRGEQLIRLKPSIALDEISRSAPSGVCPATNQPLDLEPRKIGNMLLSSCPGKKVRLNGPERGRSSVCRDLKVDLARYRAMGVRAVVCCLDDEELGSLGSPSPEYIEEVASFGLDLIRLPIAEGFAPLDLVKFDVMVTGLILTYTLQGASILVHCRGGVGRAGLVAAIWTLKMGFVSPSPPPSPSSSPSSRAEPLGATLTDATQESQTDSEAVLQTVLKLIEVVRRRRSLRAIETAEQSRFLMEFVRFLHRQEHAQRCFLRCYHLS